LHAGDGAERGDDGRLVRVDLARAPGLDGHTSHHSTTSKGVARRAPRSISQSTNETYLTADASPNFFLLYADE
jgi:hypothetical protein